MLNPGGPPKLGLQVPRVTRGVADVNARKERARAMMAEGIMIKEEMRVELSGESSGRNKQIVNNEGTLPWYIYATKWRCYE